MSRTFQTAVSWIIAWEGGYTGNAGDPGNWTGGKVGAGTLRGTKYGISAAAYPTADIANLTVADAQVLYERDYWTPIQGDALPPALAMVVFDGAVNSGVSQSAQCLQAPLGVTPDGVIGPATLGAVSKCALGATELCWEVLAQRIAANGRDPNFPVLGMDWSRGGLLALIASGVQEKLGTPRAGGSAP